MTTLADLILKVIQFVTGEHARLTAQQRDRTDRVAEYLLRIAEGLQEAADEFATNRRPWRQIYEMASHSKDMLHVIGEDIGDHSFAVELQEELHEALYADYLLLSGSVELEALDRITIKPNGRGYGDVAKDPLLKLSAAEIGNRLEKEVLKLQRASGLFRAASHKLRVARPA